MVKSNHMERAEFYGKESETDRRAWLNALRMLPVAQKPDEVGASQSRGLFRAGVSWDGWH